MKRLLSAAFYSVRSATEHSSVPNKEGAGKSFKLN